MKIKSEVVYCILCIKFIQFCKENCENVCMIGMQNIWQAVAEQCQVQSRVTDCSGWLSEGVNEYQGQLSTKGNWVPGANECQGQLSTKGKQYFLFGDKHKYFYGSKIIYLCVHPLNHWNWAT